MTEPTLFSLFRTLFFASMAILASTTGFCVDIEGQVISANPKSAKIEVEATGSIRSGDPLRYVTNVAGRVLDAGRGIVLSVDGNVIEASIASGRVNVGMSAVIELQRFIHECDTVAAIPDDIFAVSTGVSIEELDTLNAIKICRAAAKEFPEESRFQAQLARVYLAAEQPGRAILSFNRALQIEPKYPSALHNLAMIHRFGPVELRNFQQARALFRQAAELDYFASMPALGTMYREGLGGEVDHAAGAKWFATAAEEDDPYSQNAYGECFENGWGVEKSVTMALLWYRSSAEQGHPAAMRNLGSAFERGIGVQIDSDAALRWYKKAAESNDSQGQFDLGNIYLKGILAPRDFEGGIRLLEQAADNNYPQALAALGAMYYEGKTVKRDYEKAARYFFRGAKLGHAPSQYNYATFLEKGSGVTRNKDLAVDFYRKAARQGNQASQERLKRLKLEW